MSQNVRVWQVTTGDRLIEVDTSRLDFEERLENWLADDIGILDENLLVIGRQVSTSFGGFIDLLCIDSQGDLIILELKRYRTARDVVAQALDYASWVVELSCEQISEIAAQHLKRPLEEAFRERFETELPQVLNNNHRIIVVASKIDPSSERIIGYLSSRYGVSINAVTFQYFRSSENGELLTRVFLLEPEEVDYRASTKGGARRNPNLTYEEFEQIALQKGIHELYQQAFEIFLSLFRRTRTTRSSVNFVGNSQGSTPVLINLIPQESSQVDGLKFKLYDGRIRSYFNLSEDELKAVLPKSAVAWEYYANASEDWRGYQGFFTSIYEVETLVKQLGRRPVQPVS
jgi:hypothetical protein